MAGMPSSPRASSLRRARGTAGSTTPCATPSCCSVVGIGRVPSWATRGVGMAPTGHRCQGGLLPDWAMAWRTIPCAPGWSSMAATARPGSLTPGSGTDSPGMRLDQDRLELRTSAWPMIRSWGGCSCSEEVGARVTVRAPGCGTGSAGDRSLRSDLQGAQDRAARLIGVGGALCCTGAEIPVCDEGTPIPGSGTGPDGRWSMRGRQCPRGRTPP